MAEVVPLPVPEPAPEERPVLVVDFGGQYSQLIARRVRECRVYSELVHPRPRPPRSPLDNPLALVLSGGPASVYAEGAPQAEPGIFDLGVPVLGICYGMQLMARDLGGRVERTDGSRVRPGRGAGEPDSALFGGLPAEQVGWMSHGDSVTAPPHGAVSTAASRATPIAGFEDPARGLYGIQFHPEVVHTEHGSEILKNFLSALRTCPGSGPLRR